MARVIIFGVQDFAQLASFYLQNDSEHEVAAFTVDHQYLPQSGEFEGRPVVAFEDVERLYPANEFKMFAPLSHRKMNRLRESVFGRIKEKGYGLISYVSSKATRFPSTPIGENCFILEDNTLQPYTSIGDNVVLWSGNHIGHHSVIKSHVLFTSHVVLSGHCIVESYSFFGVNATIRDGLKLARGSLIAMGSCVTKDTEEWGVYKGSPAKKSDVSSADLDF